MNRFNGGEDPQAEKKPKKEKPKPTEKDAEKRSDQ